MALVFQYGSNCSDSRLMVMTASAAMQGSSVEWRQSKNFQIAFDA